MTDHYPKPEPAPARRVDVDTIADALDGLGARLALDDATVADGLYAIAGAIDRFTDTYARVANAVPTEPRPGRRVFGRQRT